MGNLMNLAVYNPAILSDADFLTGFVARNDLTEGLQGRLREITPNGLARHHLILGQRGMGKTSLLRRLALGVRDDPKLAEVLLPLTFREEQYNVHNLHTFWMNCLDALGDWFEKHDFPDKAEALDRDVAALAQGDPDGEAALEAFKRWSKAEGRRPLLLLDNIDLILDGLAEQDWSLRRAMQEAGGIVVVGATAGYLEATADPQAAFYDFFQVSVLERLGQDELLACLRRLAEARGEEGKRVREVIARDPGRIRTLYDLTGGNPRTLVLLYLLLELDSDGDVMSDLERLLDQVTVLYKARVEDLAPQARVVLDALALNWNPATAADIARLTGLETAATSTQLDRLQKAGIVEKVQISTSTRAAFQLGERFFNIWYLMRHGPRRQRTRLRWLTGFLRSFYSPEQLRERGKTLLIRGEGGDGSDYDYRLALGEAIDSSGLRLLLCQSAREGMERFAAANGKRLEDLSDPSDLPEPKTGKDWFNMAWWLDVELARYKEAEAAYHHAIELNSKDAGAWNNLGILLMNQLGRPDEAEVAYRHSIEIDPKFAYPWSNLGVLLKTYLGRPDEAETAFQRAIEIAPTYASPWNGLGALLADHFGSCKEAESAYSQALKLDSRKVTTETNMVFLLLSQPARQVEAETRFLMLLPRLPAYAAGLLTAFRALIQDNFGAAITALKAALETDHPALFTTHHDDVLRVLRLAAQRSYGDKLLAWLDEQGLSDRHWPLRAAFDAYLHGEEKLLDVNPEVRGAAKRIYDWLDAPRRHAAKSAEPAKTKRRQRAAA
ncbi:MAG: tetratricopeptide repeat protein [Gallionellaceae bacterium]|nr:tetratricopeptide repeat protein [Gallionellaceae bacterium]